MAIMENFREFFFCFFFFFLIKNRTTIWSSNPTSGYIPEGNEILPYDPAIPLLGIYWKEVKSYHMIQQSHFWVYTRRKWNLTIWSSNPTSGYIPEGSEINLLKTRLHPSVCCGIVYNGQGMETSQVSTDGGMDTENTTFININTHVQLSLEQLTHCKVKHLLVTYSGPWCAWFSQPRILQYCSIYCWKKSIWTHAVQTHLAQGSKVCMMYDYLAVKKKADLPLATAWLKLEGIYSK